MVSFLATPFFLVLISTFVVNSEIIDDDLMVDDNVPLYRDYRYVYYPTISNFNKFKRSIGRNCISTLTNCMTPSQIERYRKFMDTFEHYPQRSF